MKILYILEHVITGRKVKFLKATITSGKRTGSNIVVLEDLESNEKNKYAIEASIYNFIRFNKWIGKEATADYEINNHGVVQTDLGKLFTIKLATEVEINDYKERKIQRDYDDEDL